MTMQRRRLAALALLGAALAACGPRRAGPVAITALPPYASRTRETLASYRFAVAQPRLLAQLPCYCNCGVFGHGSLLDCYASDHGAT